MSGPVEFLPDVPDGAAPHYGSEGPDGGPDGPYDPDGPPDRPGVPHARGTAAPHPPAASHLPAAPARARRPVRRRAASAVAAALALGGVAAWVASRPTAPPAPSPSPSGAAPTRSVAAAPALSCRAAAPAADLAAAMRRFLPALRVRADSAEQCARGAGEARQVLGESLLATSGDVRVVVLLVAHGSAGLSRWTPGVRGRPWVDLETVTRESAGLDTRVIVNGRPGARLRWQGVQDLADYLSLNAVL